MSAARVAATLAALGLLAASGQAEACLTSATANTRVEIAREQALLVWDPARKQEHFVRTVRFDTAAPDLGFVVPVPAVPEVAEADVHVFERLHELAFPKPIEGDFAFEGGAGWPWLRRTGTRRFFVSTNSLSSEATAHVKVEQTAQVAGFEVTTLAATSAEALGAWLDSRGYARPRGFEPWAQHYVAQGWHFVAFKMARADRGPALQSRAVRLSFHAERPYYPYLEPTPEIPPDQVVRGFDEAPAPTAAPLVSYDGKRFGPMPDRLPDGSWGHGSRLELYVVAPQGMRGVLDTGRAWPVEASQRGPATLGEALAGALGKDALPGAAQLTVFHDPLRVRPPSELFFEADPSPSPGLPGPTYANGVWVLRWPGLLLAALPWLGLLARRRLGAA